MVLGISAQERLGGAPPTSGLPQALYGPWERALQEVFATGEPCAFDTTSPFGGGRGEAHYYRVRYIPEFGADGSVESVLGITSDSPSCGELNRQLQ